MEEIFIGIITSIVEWVKYKKSKNKKLKKNKNKNKYCKS